ncbi:MAG: amino acid permease, partial [Eudoraea sp.]|nr:amino acid permease [Eudoraea sp.]
IIGSLLSSGLMLMNFSDGLVEQFRFMIQLSTLCCLVPYLFSTAAYVLLALKKATKGKNPIFIHLLGGLAFLFSFWAIYGAGEAVVFYGFLLLMAGVPIYVWLKISSEKS